MRESSVMRPFDVKKWIVTRHTFPQGFILETGQSPSISQHSTSFLLGMLAPYPW
jgi:hypothetical protein